MTTAPTINLDQLILEAGAHATAEQGMCVMELGAYVAREHFTDHPKCTSPVIGAFLRSLNDRMNDDERQILKPYVVQVDASGHIVLDEHGWPKAGPALHTATGTGDDETRAWMCVDWLVHEYAPAMFRFAGETAAAEAFEGLVAISSRDSYESARELIYSTRDAMWEKRQAAVKRAAGAVAGAGAVAVAGAVAGAGAVAVAVAGAGAVAVAVAVAGAGAVAVAVAGADAVAVAVAVADAGAIADADADADAGPLFSRELVLKALAAAKAAGGDYWDQRTAAYEVFLPVAKEKLEPVAAGLRVSALLLLDRMIEVGKESKAA